MITSLKKRNFWQLSLTLCILYWAHCIVHDILLCKKDYLMFVNMAFNKIGFAVEQCF